MGYFWMNFRGQSTVELFMVLAISIIALGLVYSLYADQIFAASSTKETALARATVQKVVDAANMVYYSGAGSTARVFVEIPETADLTQSEIVGRSVALRLKGGGDVVATADTNISGAWKPITGKYFFYVVYDGNVVKFDYRPFELNKESIFVSGIQGSTRSSYFSIKNASLMDQECWVEITYPHTLVNLIPSPDYASFTLTPNESKRIDLNFVLSANSSGNYAGKVDVTCELDDVNSTRTIFISAESLLKVDYVLLYSKNVINWWGGGTRIQKYIVCNLTDSAINSVSWEMRDSNIPPAWYNNSFNPSINSLDSASCESFYVTFNLGGAADGTYVGHPTVKYPNPDSNFYSATLTIIVD